MLSVDCKLLNWMELGICKWKNIKNGDYFWKSWSALHVTHKKPLSLPSCGNGPCQGFGHGLATCCICFCTIHSAQKTSGYTEGIIARTEMSPGSVKANSHTKSFKMLPVWNFSAWPKEVKPRISRIKPRNGKMRNYFKSLWGSRIYSHKKQWVKHYIYAPMTKIC